jgi:hypothetical protein
MSAGLWPWRRMEHCAGRSVHLTPSGLDFDEQRVQLVRAAPSVACLSWGGSCCTCSASPDADHPQSHPHKSHFQSYCEVLCSAVCGHDCDKMYKMQP